MGIDLTKGPEGEDFTYRGYQCRISYGGIRPRFSVDGERIHQRALREMVGHPGRSAREWKQTLKEYIDILEES